MYIQLLSDLHNEFFQPGASPDIEPCESDMIVLAGDIGLGLQGLLWAEAQARWLEKPIIYVAGNHEFYHHDLSLLEKMRAFTEGKDYLYFLENDEIVISNVRILGCTLWTDYRAAGDPVLSMLEIRQNLNDHHVIANGTRNFLPEDALKIHKDSRVWLEKRLTQSFNGKSMVVTHHAPHLLCQHPSFPLDAFSSAFLSDMAPYIEMADVWCFGHTHANMDEQIGNCRLVSNQRGYPAERVSGYNPSFILEV